jgi:intron-binding protein aquarius
MSRPSLEEIKQLAVYKLASENWLDDDTKKKKKRKKFQANVVSQIYKEIQSKRPGTLVALEYLQYLERYLWPNFTTNVKNDHVVSIALMACAKHREEAASVWGKLDVERF